jgi:hypothetical protein
MSPATSQMMEDFNSTSELLQAFMVSIFVLGVSQSRTFYGLRTSLEERNLITYRLRT